jgi:hypothetical protein
MKLRRCAWIAFLAAGLFGCGDRSDQVPVSGVVTLNEQALSDAIVTFYPEGDTPGQGGGGTTGPDGKYTLTPATSGRGLPPGDYMVVISRPRGPDGSPPLPNVAPMDSDARETLPAIYSARETSKLHAKVTKEKSSYDFALLVGNK